MSLEVLKFAGLAFMAAGVFGLSFFGVRLHWGKDLKLTFKDLNEEIAPRDMRLLKTSGLLAMVGVILVLIGVLIEQ